MFACQPEGVGPDEVPTMDERASPVLGSWNLKRYSYIAKGKGALIEQDAGIFEVKEDGMGSVDVDVPGMSHAQAATFKWTYDEENKKLTLDYEDGSNVDEFEVLALSESAATLRREWSDGSQSWIIDMNWEK